MLLLQSTVMSKNFAMIIPRNKGKCISLLTVVDDGAAKAYMFN